MDDKMDDNLIGISIDGISSANGLTCKNCNKDFKKKLLYDKHITLQSCIEKVHRTNCILCMAVMNSRDEYERHLLSVEHYNKVSSIGTVSPAKYVKPSGYTINYTDERSEVYDIPNPIMPTPTEIKRQKIINNIPKVRNHGQKGADFFNDLLIKLDMADYTGLCVAIQTDINIEAIDKQFALNIIKTFMVKLKSLVREGVPMLGNKNINDILAALIA